MNKTILTSIFLATIIVSTILITSSSLVSADWFSWITGRATSQGQTLNITISNNAPQITAVFPVVGAGTTVTPTEAGATAVMFNFTVTDNDGYANLLDSTAKMNASRGGEITRTNTSCIRYQQGGNTANYSCSIDMWYFDGNGIWNVTTWISDASFTNATNTTANISYSQLQAFVRGPATTTFASIGPGATNTTANNAPILLNNTGNYAVAAGNLLINATNLRGELNSTLAIWANNMSVGNQSGTNSCGSVIQNATTMTASVYADIKTALERGNFTFNNGTAQRGLYPCIRLVGNELSGQSYSTSIEGSWTIKEQ